MNTYSGLRIMSGDTRSERGEHKREKQVLRIESEPWD
jgi:hypothetical protein